MAAALMMMMITIYDACVQCCRPSENVSKKKRHQSEQSQRVRRESVPVPEETDVVTSVKGDSHVSVIQPDSLESSFKGITFLNI